MSNLFQSGRYIDLKTADINLDREYTPRNAEEALHRALIFIYNYDRIEGQDLLLALDQVKPFIDTDTRCAAIYAALHISRLDRNDAQALWREAVEILKPSVLEQLEQLVEDEDQFGLILSGLLHDRGQGFSKDTEQSKILYQRAIDISAAQNEDGKSDQLANFLLGLIYNREVGAARDAGEDIKASEIYGMLRSRFIIAADGGITSAQLMLADMYIRELKALGKYPSASGVNREAVAASVENYLWRSLRHGMEGAVPRLLEHYASETAGVEKLEPLYHEIAKTDILGTRLLARLLDRQRKYKDAVTLYEDIAKRRNEKSSLTIAKDSLAYPFTIYDAFEGDLKIAEYYSEGKPDIPKDEKKAFLRAVTILKAKNLPNVSTTDAATAIFDRLKGRAWITARNNAFQQFRLTDNFSDPSFVFLPDDPEAAFIILRDKAQPDPENFNPRVPIDLARALVERYEQGLGTAPDMGTALRYHRRIVIVDPSAVASIMAIVEHSSDLIEVARLAQQLQPARGRSRFNLVKGQIEIVQNRQREIFGESEGQWVRIWIPEGKTKVMRPLTRTDSNFNGAVLAPNPAEDLFWYEEAAKNGSKQAAAIVEKIRNPVVEAAAEPAEQRPALPATPPVPLPAEAMPAKLEPAPAPVAAALPAPTPPSPAPPPAPEIKVEPEEVPAARERSAGAEILQTPGPWVPELEEAERYGKRGSSDYDPQRAYDLLVQVFTEHSDVMPPGDVTRVAKVEETVLEDAWVLGKNEVFHPLKKSVHQGLEYNGETVYFLPPNSNSLDILAEHAGKSADAAIEYAFRLAKGIGCDYPQPAAALCALSAVMIDPTKISGNLRFAVVPAQSHRRAELMQLFEEVAETVEVRVNRRARHWEFISRGENRNEAEVTPDARVSLAMESFIGSNYTRLGKAADFVVD